MHPRTIQIQAQAQAHNYRQTHTHRMSVHGVTEGNLTLTLTKMSGEYAIELVISSTQRQISGLSEMNQQRNASAEYFNILSNVQHTLHCTCVIFSLMQFCFLQLPNIFFSVVWWELENLHLAYISVRCIAHDISPFIILTDDGKMQWSTVECEIKCRQHLYRMLKKPFFFTQNF